MAGRLQACQAAESTAVGGSGLKGPKPAGRRPLKNSTARSFPRAVHPDFSRVAGLSFVPSTRYSRAHLVATVRLTWATVIVDGVLVEAEQSGAASQAGSQQPLPASQAGSQQPLPASQAGSQQLVPQQLFRWQRFLAAWTAFRRSRIGVCFLRQLVPQQESAPQLGSQQPAPASQAGSQQPLPASQAGSQQPLPASQAGSQQPLPASQAGSQQLLCFRLHFSNNPFRPPNRSCLRHFRVPQQDEPQQPSPAPASQAGSQQPLPASQPGSQQPSPAPASQPGSQHEVQPLQPSIRSRSSKPKDWLQTVTPRTSAPRNNIRFIEPHLLCLWTTVVFVPLATLSPEVVIHERFFCGRPVEPFRDSRDLQVTVAPWLPDGHSDAPGDNWAIGGGIEAA